MNEFEAFGDVALVAHEKKSAWRACLLGGLFLSVKFGTERDALTYNATRIGSLWREISARIGLADVSCERAAFLTIRIEFKVVVPRGIPPEGWIVFEGSEIDGRAYPLSIQ